MGFTSVMLLWRSNFHRLLFDSMADVWLVNSRCRGCDFHWYADAILLSATCKDEVKEASF